jgi:2-polyprenyl-3-methyl-5-hydroxy-6-metoxy-1,4-benzoquinol methylase
LLKLAQSLVAKVANLDVAVFPRSGKGSFFARAHGDSLAPLGYTYRAGADGMVSYQVRESATDLEYRLYTMEFSRGRIIPGKLCLSCTVPQVNRGDRLRVCLVEPDAWINEQPIVPMHRERHASRKYLARVEVRGAKGRAARVCVHYLPFDNKAIGKDYYFGDDYVDYPRETSVKNALDLVRRYCARGRLLDVGCALGIYTKAFQDAGFDAYGVDVSEFAVAEAVKVLGPGRVVRCDLDLAPIPFDGKFDIIWLWDVLEHAADPRGLLEKVTSQAGSGSWLFLHTSNAESLTRFLFKEDWEGLADYSHKGVLQVSASTVPRWLGDLGWTIQFWECGQIWVTTADPVWSRLEAAFNLLPELKTLLSERNLGDMIVAVARKD